MPADQYFDLAGLMVRAPSATAENHFLGAVGFGAYGYTTFEHGNTIAGGTADGEVAWMVGAAPSGDADLRLCRERSVLWIYHRHPGESTWLGPDSASRTDFPATVQVGLCATTDAPAPDFIANFDSFTFESLGAGCVP